ncbi:hypothetical protein AVEN_41841-1 [Araneus ventricosus]|uniref:Uncharacterized protein n=1 Tax=Araneus ventricosus TaxID=182803 RepID=A0A4Y2AC44_ARAVE|nr:hypothetical protein AVEN_41841-1 [Araneus ventricosus]
MTVGDAKIKTHQGVRQGKKLGTPGIEYGASVAKGDFYRGLFASELSKSNGQPRRSVQHRINGIQIYNSITTQLCNRTAFRARHLAAVGRDSKSKFWSLRVNMVFCP